ncbi:MAG: hypothetical protein Q8Q14_06725 [Gemmatimonadales bacterium]|nr:hypothetical protein [Gemmatimonadales bacterium]
MDGIAVRLERLKREARKEWKRRVKRLRRGTPQARAKEWRALAGAVAGAVLKVALIFALPFAVLVRGAVFFHQYGRIPVWLALLVAALITCGIVTAYAAWVSHRLTGRARALFLGKWVAMPLVIVFCGHSLLYLARVNAKAEPVRAYYTSVHPLLRLALSTLILADGDIVVTDFGRQPADYRRMGLPVNSRTRHYRKSDGWVHAVDVRTTGRGAVRNRTVQFYFWLMGFETRRHVGTADHLHVELRQSR